MARFTPTKPTLLSSALPYINSNFDQLSTLIEQMITRDGSGSNELLHDLDANHFKLLNVADAENDTDAVSLGQVNTLISGLRGDKGDKGDPGSPGQGYATRSLMAARANPSVGDDVYLTETGRQGKFVVVLYSSVTAQVAADTTQGIYVRSTADTSKVYVRVVDGWVNLKWFGIVGGNASGANGAANYAAWLSMLATLRARIPAGLAPTFLYQPLEPIYAPMDFYEFSQTLDLTNGTGKLIGDQTGAGTISTTFKFPVGQSGFRSQRYNSEGSGTTSSPTHLGGDSWMIDGICVQGGYYDTGNNRTEGEFHGFEIYAQIVVKNFTIQYFQGDGIYVATNTGTSLADNCHFENGYIHQCRRGRFATGGDSNVAVYSGIHYANNRTWGIEDNCFLGSTEIQPHSASNGWDGANGSIPTACNIGGSRYYVKLGQAANCSTNSPKASTVTITIASPGVVTWTGHGLTARQKVTFSTTGALPTGLSANTAYYVANPTTNTFELSTTAGGASINTSGTQSGTHTSGAQVDNTYWGSVGAGGTYSGVVPWVSGTTFREGGSYKFNNGNSRMVVIGAYSESDQNPAQGNAPMLYLGGLGPAEQPGSLGIHGSTGGIGFGPGVGSPSGLYSNSLLNSTQLGGDPTNSTNSCRVLTTVNTIYEPIGMGLMWGRGVGGVTDPSNLYWNQNNSNSFLRFTPFGTTAQFGTGVAQPYYFQPINFALGPPDDTARKITVGAAAPTTGAHAAGEIVFNNGTVTSVATTSYWQCTAAGTPGTWNAHA